MASHERANRFVDYFVICGLDETTELEPDKLAGDNQHCPPLERPYKSRVLNHFPETVPWNPFDENAVGMLCMPQGLSFKTQWDPRQAKFHSFIITREDGSHSFGTALVFFEEVTNKSVLDTMQTLYLMHQASTAAAFSVDSPEPVRRILPEHRGKGNSFDGTRDKLFVSKCICLVTPLPFVRPGHQFLHQLYEASLKPNLLALTLESYVFNIIYEVPLPPCGSSMKFFGCSSPIYVIRPSLKELPLFDFSLYDMFMLLGVDAVVHIFKCVLLEHQVLLYSSDYQRLMLVAEGMSAVIFPFQWQLVYVPILPASMQHFLDAPVPFIMGLCKVSNVEKSQLVLPCEANMCFVDIDNKQMEFPEDIPMFPYQTELKRELAQVLIEFQNLFNDEHTSTSPLWESALQNSHSPSTDEVSQSNNAIYPNTPTRNDILSPGEAWTKASSLETVKVWNSLEDIVLKDRSHSEINKDKTIPGQDNPDQMSAAELTQYKFNSAVRQVFLNCFVHIFASYENFVISPSQDLDTWMSNRETVHNFDKAAFLSDQPVAHLPFLSAFIETQMFTTMVDNKIVSQWEEADPGVRLFDARIKDLKETAGGEESRVIAFNPCQTLEQIDQSIERRAKNISFVASEPHEISSLVSQPSNKGGSLFSLLDKNLLNTEPANSKSKYRENTLLRRMDRQKQQSLKGFEAEQQEFSVVAKQASLWAQYVRIRKPQLPDMSQAGKGQMTQTNWKFVETLLKEGKMKTKKMLVDKIGQEAVELGHNDANITGVEENTLIASLCDLMERIWSHGLQHKKGKSAVWSHLLSYQEVEESSEASKAGDAKTPGIDLTTMGGEQDKTTEKTHRRRGSQGRIELPVLRPMLKLLLSDMKKIQQMSDIHTDVGKTRALIRLALERKLLSFYLKQLLADADLLRRLYKRYAFLRCEDEREQFFFHLLSLNAVDFFCFTNTFPNTVVLYRVLIYPSTKLGCSTTSANVWLSIAGQLGETGAVEVPKGQLEMNFEHKNLGVLTTLRLGHDNSGMLPKWLVEYVLVRNELTGHTYRFNCGRWLGRGIDDGSTERLLVGELMHHTIDTEDEVVVTSPPKTCSPKSPRRSNSTNVSLAEIQENLGQAVNNLVKHLYKPEKEQGNITYLLCGDKGLVHCMEQVFQFGFRSSRIFRNKIFIWDYMERLKAYFENALTGNTSSELPEVYKAGYWLFSVLVSKINTASDTVGKDGKFQVFICVGIRRHCLHRWLPLMANTTVTAQMYEEKSFLRIPSHTNFVMHILDSLTEFDIPVEASLLRGIDVDI